MSRFPETAVALAAAALIAAPAMAEDTRGLGRTATPEEIAAWDIDIRPDGQGLPEGSGSVLDGEPIYLERCAVCHGDFGEGIGRWPVLSGGEGTLSDQRPVKTIGSYWPFLSTVFDYVYRAMPFGYAQSMTDDEVYAVTAYLLYLNYIVEDDFVLSKETFADVEMPNAGNFYMDPRPDTPIYAQEDPCMENCREAPEITMRAAVLDVTPEGLAGTEGEQTD
jgi:cytochrome c